MAQGFSPRADTDMLPFVRTPKLFLAALMAFQIFAQSPPAKAPAFEVASVKPLDSTDRRNFHPAIRAPGLGPLHHVRY